MDSESDKELESASSTETVTEEVEELAADEEPKIEID